VSDQVEVTIDTLFPPSLVYMYVSLTDDHIQVLVTVCHMTGRGTVKHHVLKVCLAILDDTRHGDKAEQGNGG
jgi:hypothetical protein